ncbi:hypothetical protein WN51_14368 [Melipona quadrifasciata]|uniref:Uncharacterized protein n=1 Tax=Melipona quadrifasciata TaxID=166423 RepID=A0A0N0BFN1_9HYME|nr:hypothetical protein WN51_14368 [Melipona quadrifasciata]
MSLLNTNKKRRKLKNDLLHEAICCKKKRNKNKNRQEKTNKENENFPCCFASFPKQLLFSQIVVFFQACEKIIDSRHIGSLRF